MLCGMHAALPTEAEVVVVGGGTAGAAVAARLAEAGLDVLVLEAGPDPGPLGDPRWPADLVDAARLGTSCDWGFDSGATYADQVVRFERARILGGCSAHNGAVQTWGHRADYDGWAALGNPGWATDDLLPAFERASAALRVRTYAPAELTPWQRAWYEAGPAAGLPHLADLNDVDETVGIAPESVNVVDGVRFNSAFAYLDPIRELPNLRIAGDALVDRVLVSRGRATGVAVVHDGATVAVAAETVILTGGTFCSPAVLLRSGVGPAEDLRALGIDVAVPLPGVGENLHDQPFALLTWEGSDEITRAMDAAAAAGWAPDEQVMAKAASSADPDVFDLHLLPYSPTHLGEERTWHAGASYLTPVSRGRVALTGRDPEALPTVDHGFLTDPLGHDAAILAEGVALLREIAAQPDMRRLLGKELSPGRACRSHADIARHLRAHIDSYWHPVGTCKMGPASDPLAVVDARGEVHGLRGCYVADCAIMPFVPRATTALPAVVIGERMAELLLASRPAATPRR
jgi:choline dehydrogenase